MEIKVNRLEVIEVLTAKLPAARAFDQKSAIQHQRDVERCAEARRVFLNRLLTLSNRELAELNLWETFNESRSKNDAHHGVSCPMSVETQLQDVIAALEHDNRKTLTISAGEGGGSSWHGSVDWAWNWTPEKKNRTVC